MPVCWGGCGSDSASSSGTKGASFQEDPNDKRTYNDGKYKVGTDLKASEYIVVSNGKGKSFIDVMKDDGGSFESSVASDMFTTRSIITVSDGQIFEVMNATIYTPAAAPKVEPKDGVLPESMYRVGKDLPAGTYKVSKKGTDSYVEITSTSTRAENDTIAYETIKDEIEITVKDGQYLRMSSAELKLK